MRSFPPKFLCLLLFFLILGCKVTHHGSNISKSSSKYTVSPEEYVESVRKNYKYFDLSDRISFGQAFQGKSGDISYTFMQRSSHESYLLDAPLSRHNFKWFNQPIDQDNSLDLKLENSFGEIAINVINDAYWSHEDYLTSMKTKWAKSGAKFTTTDRIYLGQDSKTRISESIATITTKLGYKFQTVFLSYARKDKWFVFVATPKRKSAMQEMLSQMARILIDIHDIPT
ncbi:hypothetical protein [Curvivirga sp.]|uniref:hypothetical protein n=1 Tax=Curvivirga sp. TaxID=2856848 RepID=UPI003B5A88E0